MPIDRETLRQLEHAVRPLRIAIANLGARGVVSLVDDSKNMQALQLGVLSGETIDGAEHFQPYGFSSVPLPPDDSGAPECAIIFPGGDRGHPIVTVVADRRHRRTGAPPGDVTMRHFTGAMVTFTEDGDIILEPAPGRKVLAGGPGAATPPALSSELADLKSRISTWTPVPNDGGASLKTVFSAWPVPGATKVDVE